eukprot:129760-Chlamydomonas_euryale.AAC.2
MGEWGGGGGGGAAQFSTFAPRFVCDVSAHVVGQPPPAGRGVPRRERPLHVRPGVGAHDQVPGQLSRGVPLWCVHAHETACTTSVCVRVPRVCAPARVTALGTQSARHKCRAS